jgi:hypothetical protein
LSLRVALDVSVGLAHLHKYAVRVCAGVRV